MAAVSLAALNRMPVERFNSLLGGVFECSPWVAKRVVDQRPFDRLDDLHAAMVATVEAATRDEQRTLIRAHPELAGKAAIRGELTGESTREQASAGLDQCSAEEFQQLHALNRAYSDKFGFPFILAVRGYDRQGIISEFQRRLERSVEAEERESLQQIYRIARLRLNDLIGP